MDSLDDESLMNTYIEARWHKVTEIQKNHDKWIDRKNGVCHEKTI